MNRSDALAQVNTLISRDRAQQYGDAGDSFARIAQFWSIYLGRQITRHDVANMMVLFKASRLAHNPKHEDSLLDIAGYAALNVEMCDDQNDH